MINVLGTILVFVIAAGGQAPSKPNLSGEWKMNPAKSDFGRAAAAGVDPPHHHARGARR